MTTKRLAMIVISVLLFTGAMTRVVMASIINRGNNEQNAVYHVKTIIGKEVSLEDIKNKMGDIAAHMATLKGAERLNIYVVFHGSNINYLVEEKIDPELASVIQSFLLKGVKMAVCKECLGELNISPETLAPGLDLITVRG